MFDVCECAELVERGYLPPSGGVVINGARREDVGFGGGETPGGVSGCLCEWSALCHSFASNSAGSNQLSTLMSWSLDLYMTVDASGSSMLYSLGEIRTTGPYFLCNSTLILWYSRLLIALSNQRRVNLAIQGPGTCLKGVAYAW